MLSSSGPENIPGNKVMTSTFIADADAVRPASQRAEGSWSLLLVHQLEGAAQALFGAAGLQQSADGIDGLALAPDDASGIGRVEAQLVNRLAAALHRGHRNGVRVLH